MSINDLFQSISSEIDELGIDIGATGPTLDIPVGTGEIVKFPYDPDPEIGLAEGGVGGVRLSKAALISCGVARQERMSGERAGEEMLVAESTILVRGTVGTYVDDKFVPLLLHADPGQWGDVEGGAEGASPLFLHSQHMNTSEAFADSMQEILVSRGWVDRNRQFAPTREYLFDLNPSGNSWRQTGLEQNGALMLTHIRVRMTRYLNPRDDQWSGFDNFVNAALRNMVRVKTFGAKVIASDGDNSDDKQAIGRSFRSITGARTQVDQESKPPRLQTFPERADASEFTFAPRAVNEDDEVIPVNERTELIQVSPWESAGESALSAAAPSGETF